MEFLRRAFTRIRAIVVRDAIERDMNDEMRLHINLLAEEYERAGMPIEDAKRAARLRFGNVAHVQERSRDIRGAGLLEDLRRDLQYGVQKKCEVRSSATKRCQRRKERQHQDSLSGGLDEIVA